MCSGRNEDQKMVSYFLKIGLFVGYLLPSHSKCIVTLANQNWFWSAICQKMADIQLLFLALYVYVSYVCNTHYVIVTTHAQVHCLICTHDARGHATPKGMQHLRASAAISGHVLQLICNSSSTLTVKTCPNILPLTALPVPYNNRVIVIMVFSF